MSAEEFILKRHPDNPIITPADFPGAAAVFNPGQTMFEGKTLLLVAVFYNRSRMVNGQRVKAGTHVATSTDGIHFDIEPEAFINGVDNPFYADLHDQPIDMRITKMEDAYYIVHPACGQWGTFGLLGRTTDFKKHEYLGVISLPDNRVPCLFPEKIGGKYLRIDRPYRVAPNDFHDFGHLWLSASPDLLHWGDHRPLLRGYAPWGTTKIGPTPPIKTKEGWLVIIHGVSESCSGHRYSIGAILLDLENPDKIIGKTQGAILAPYKQYELTGIVPNVVFPCGAIADTEKDSIRVYYGCADTSIGLAEGSLSELIQACKEEW